MSRYAKVVLGASLLLPSLFWLFKPAACMVEDCYFYLVIARNIVTTGAQTFNGVFTTNGFHPLWAYVLSAYSLPLAWIHPQSLYYAGFGAPLVIALLVLGVINFAAVARRWGVDPLILIAPQIAFLAPFSILNSEAHLSYFSLSLLTRLASGEAGKSRLRPLWIGLALAAVFLSRLDSVFFVLAFLVWYVARERDWTRIAKMMIAAAVPAGSYLLANRLFFGGFAPVSGYLKSTFPHVWHNNKWFESGGVAAWVLGYHVVFGVAPLVLAVLVAVVARRALGGARSMLLVYVVGVAGQFADIAFFTRGLYVGWYWYYVLPVVCGSLAVAILAAHWQLRPAWQHAFATVILVFAAVILLSDKAGSKLEDHAGLYSVRTLDFLQRNGVEDQTVVVSEWPGLSAFRTTNRIVQLDMLMANRDVVESMLASPNALQYLIDECTRRGRRPTYFIYGGKCIWCAVSKDQRKITYFNPRRVPLREPIGELELGEPLVAEPVGDTVFMVWKL